MAQPSVVSPSASSSAASVSVVDTSELLSSLQEPMADFFDESLFASSDFVAPPSSSSPPQPQFNTTQRALFLENNNNNNNKQDTTTATSSNSSPLHSGSVNSHHSVHSGGHSNSVAAVSATSLASNLDDSSRLFVSYDTTAAAAASEQPQLLPQLDQPGTSQEIQQSTLLMPSSPATSPQSSLELSSLQQSLEKNRESLKHKLSHRASIRELVCRGIYPSPRIPIGHVEQRRKLERAKTRDFLRHHFQKRPNREYLVGQNILPADGRVDFRIAARQKELKKCRLAENLNQHLVTRPGPLDLVDRNILEAPQQLHRALRAGLLPISSTKTESPTPDLASASESSHSPYYGSVDTMTTMPSPAAFVFDPVVASGTTFVHATPTNAAIPMIIPSNQQLAVYTPVNVVAPNRPPCDYVILQQPDQSSQPQSSIDVTTQQQSFSNNLSNANSNNNIVQLVEDPSLVVTAAKKGAVSSKSAKGPVNGGQKAKPQTLKFHEYKGPPEIVKATKQQQSLEQSATQHPTLPPSAVRRLTSTSASAARDHLSAIINQQSLYLKYQKYCNNGSPLGSVSLPTLPSNQPQQQPKPPPPPPLPPPHFSHHQRQQQQQSRNSTSPSIPISSTEPPTPVPTPSSSVVSPLPSTRASQFSSSSSTEFVTRQVLFGLKVSDLKSYCRELGLPISGTKQALIDRLDDRLNGAKHSQMPVSILGPSHSSSALFFGDVSNDNMVSSLHDKSCTGNGEGRGVREGEIDFCKNDDIDEVITISSSASSPGILHEADMGIGSIHNNTNGADNSHNAEEHEQLRQLHHRVESQQRHIEQLKAELQIERQKRWDENSTANKSPVEGQTPAVIQPYSPMNLDSWQEKAQRVRDNSATRHENGIGGNMQTNCESNHDLDDIMDLVGSFSDINSTNGNMALLQSPFFHGDAAGNHNGTWAPDMGMAPLDANSSPMSPWLFDSDNLNFAGVITNGFSSGNSLQQQQQQQQPYSHYRQTPRDAIFNSISSSSQAPHG